MIAELRVRDFAVIHDVSMTLTAGLNVLTGETGAGKSILVDALALLLGGRATGDVVRPGQDRSVVEGVFDVTNREDLARYAETLGLEVTDGLLVIKRDIAVQGRSRAWVNGSPTTVAVLAQLGEALVDLHGQHATQSLLRPDAQRDLLDAFADATAERRSLAEVYADWEGLRREYDALAAHRDEAIRRADYLRHVVDEITRAELTPGEDERLDVELTRLGNAEELSSLAAAIADAVDDEERGVRAAADRTAREHAHLEKLDPSTSAWREWLDATYANLDELSGAARAYAESVEHDPERLASIERRRGVVLDLTRKYGQDVEAVLRTLEEACGELALLDTADHDLAELQERIAAAERSRDGIAETLSAKRSAGAERLAGDVSDILPELGLPGGSLRVSLAPRLAVESHGAEEVVFEVALNVGHEHRPLSKVASGGELSRVMLALKAVLARQDALPTLIFDEVDQGIGGEVGGGVGTYLGRVAEHHQVLVITHLPQIAAKGHTHLVATKTARKGEVIADVHTVDGAERIAEVARMLGDAEGDTARSHARELLTPQRQADVRPRARSRVAR